ncbi:MAG: alpha-glucosidase/alpha-galactosidase [Firmicutes bacterium]|nr:alpha-glucosidase/alpha-galactosidase [Bacillota bacterium]
MFDPTTLTIAYIGGGSRAWAWTFMTDLALDAALGGVIRLYDIDEAAAKSNELIGNRLSGTRRSAGKWRYVTAPTLRDALMGADFVVISILPGTFEQMKADVHLPERLGIYQSVGDTTGPGGIIRALRTVPMYVGFAEAIREYSPNAWVINYTNPMGLCVRTLYHVFPQMKAFGCCHEVFGAQSLLKAMARRELSIADVERGDIHVNVLGINHFTWFDRASCRGHDLMPMYARFADAFYDEGFSNDGDPMPDKCFTCRNRVKFDLFRKYGWIAAAGDRHLAEFMPGDLYLKNPQTAESWGFHLTSVDWRVGDLRRRLQKSAELVSGAREMDLTPSGEEGILLIKALCGLTRVVSNVNLPNTAGQIPNLPRETVVETNALFSFDAIRPVPAGELTEDIQGLILPHAQNQTEILGAALRCDTEAVYRAFGRDPLACGRSARELRELADDMIRATLKYLPDGWKRGATC